MRRTLVAVALAAALVLAGCAGPGGEGVNNTTNDTGVGNDTGLDNDTGDETDGMLGNDTNETNDTGILANETNVSVVDG